MNIIEALKELEKGGIGIKRESKPHIYENVWGWVNFIEECHDFCFRDLLAEDWEVIHI